MIAVFGGSFDPIHIGHLRLAEDVREYFGFRQVVFMPAHISPFKEGHFASAEDRINMIKLSIKDNPYFKVSDFEIKKGGKSYTIDTIKFLKQEYENIFFILGTDTLLSLHKWKDHKKLVNLTNFIILLRGDDLEKNVENYIKKYFPEKTLVKNNNIDLSKTSFYLHKTRKIDISSTEIRKRIKEGRSIKYLVLPSVEKYIEEKKLYL